MRITILSIGKFENSPHRLVFEDYLRRLKWKVELKELESKNPKISEEELILKALNPASKLIACDEKGKQFSSREFAKIISDLAVQGDSNLTFVIGGADGLSEKILKKSSLKISFGLMTLPHLMAR
ncbi:MAG: hypothetical protein A2794_00955, partial [Alphaproteobacteria bacterium RIFCSPHIGHO2_01_FULL_40_8]